MNLIELVEIGLFTPKARVLFQGDSITDGNRGRTEDPNHILGHGYVFIIAARYGAAFPERGVEFINRGVSANKVCDLEKRWSADTIHLAPTALSILIGVNDLGGDVTATEFEQRYDRLLQQTVGLLPKVALVLVEPFGLPTGAKKQTWRTYRGDLAVRQRIVRQLAQKHSAIFVPVQDALEDAAEKTPAEHWIWDGVHPTYSGHQIIADQWIRAVSAASAR